MADIDFATGESELIGGQTLRDGLLTHDDVAVRLKWLIKNLLKEVETSADGWEKLYVDPRDGRLWKLHYPSSASHGGGAPWLSLVEK